MIGTLITTSALALITAGVAMPMTRRMMLGNIKEDWLAGELELDHIATDTVHLKNGKMFRVIRITGTPYETKPEQIQINLRDSRSDWLHQLGQIPVTLKLFGVKRHRSISFESEWPSSTLAEIGEKEKHLFENSYEVRWYIILESKNLRHLTEATKKTEALLSSYEARVLTVSEDDQPCELSSCELSSFIHYLLSGEFATHLPTISHNISARLPQTNLAFDADGTITTQTPLPHYQKIISITGWAEEVSGMMPSEVMSIAGDIELCQVVEPIADDKVRALLIRKNSELNATAFFGGGGALREEGSTVVELISEGKSSLYTTQYQITVRACDKTHLEEMIQKITGILSRRRILYTVETKPAPICWFNRIPGESTLIRPLKLMNENIASLWTFAYSPLGSFKSPWGEQPVRLFATPTGQAYSFQYHVSAKPQALGHYLVFAPSGSGKSTLMMHLLGGMARFPAVKSYVFDSNQGTRYMIEAMGGHYQSFDNLALNPLDVGADTLSNRQQVTGVLRAMLGSVPIADLDEIMPHVLDLVFKLETPKRTFNEIFEYGFSRGTEARKAMSAWVQDKDDAEGIYARVFNSPKDSLGSVLDSFMVGINMNEALSDPVLAPPIVTHISNAISKVASRSASGFNIFIDEGANLLQNEGFKSVVQVMFREYRKLNGVVGMAFQDPEALAKTGIADAVLQNVSTLIFFPNAMAGPNTYTPFNLNAEQLEFINKGTPSGGGEGRGREVLVVKRDPATGWEESVILNIDLAPLGDAVRFYRSGTDAIQQIEALQEQWGEEWRRHL